MFSGSQVLNLQWFYLKTYINCKALWTDFCNDTRGAPKQWMMDFNKKRGKTVLGWGGGGWGQGVDRSVRRGREHSQVRKQRTEGHNEFIHFCVWPLGVIIHWPLTRATRIRLRTECYWFVCRKPVQQKGAHLIKRQNIGGADFYSRM